MVSESELRRERLRHAGWIGVDLDGTCFTYHKWVGWNVFGEPIGPMIERIRRWLFEERDVRIVTARVGLPLFDDTYSDKIRISTKPIKSCHVTGQMFSDRMMVNVIQDLTEHHVGARLPVQCYKDVNMIELWDDRAVQVVPNTGQTLTDAHEAELSALRGKTWESTSDPTPRKDHDVNKTGA